MLRVKYNSLNKHWYKIFNLSKGYRKSNSTLKIYAKEQLIQSFYYSYISRRLKKRKYKSKWISRVNKYCKLYNINYSDFLTKLHKKNIFINTKILALLANINNSMFKELLFLE